MKKLFFVLLFAFGAISFGFSQEFSYGLKGGINYTLGGQISNAPDDPSNEWSGTLEGNSKIGFHGGAFLQVDFGKFFVRPELVYTSLKTAYDFDIEPVHHTIEKFDIPFMLGYNVYGPVDVFLGPVYSNIINSNIEGEESGKQIVVQSSPINFQAGVKVEFGRFGIDVRYEKTLSAPEVQDLDFAPNEYGTNLSSAKFIDPQVDQIIVGVIFKLGGPGLNQRQRRACY